MSYPLNKQQHNNSKRKRIARSISVTGTLNKPKPFIKTEMVCTLLESLIIRASKLDYNMENL
jgi:hypothetical protein